VSYGELGFGERFAHPCQIALRVHGIDSLVPHK